MLHEVANNSQGSNVEIFAERLRRLRKSKGFSQEELSVKSGIHRGMISHFEAGIKTNPNLSTILKIAKALECQPHILTDDPKLASFIEQTLYAMPTDHEAIMVLEEAAEGMERATRPPNADASSIPRMAPMPPSKAKHVRQSRQHLRAAMETMAKAQEQLLETQEPEKLAVALRAMAKVQRSVLAAQDELDKLMEGL